MESGIFIESSVSERKSAEDELRTQKKNHFCLSKTHILKNYDWCCCNFTHTYLNMHTQLHAQPHIHVNAKTHKHTPTKTHMHIDPNTHA